MILLDYSGIAISNIVVQKLMPEEDLLRHMILNSIRLYRKKYKEQYGEIVLCVDGGGNWRKEIYPEYKAGRAKGRKESDLDWGKIFEILNKILDEIKENFPYKVVQEWGAEADDIIATLVEYTQEFGKNEPVMIVSADKDFIQLQKYSNVSQYSYVTKKLVKNDNPYQYLDHHIYKGDGSDGVPNILSPDNTFVEGIRQKPITKKKIALWDEAENLQDVMDTETFRNWQRNKKMIDLSEIPEDLSKKILDNYLSQDRKKNKQKVMNFLIQKRCKLLLESLGDFIQ